MEPDPPLLGQVGVAVGDLLGQPDQVDRLHVEGPTLDPGQVEQVPGQDLEALGLAADPLGEAAPGLWVIGKGGQQGLGQGPDRGHRRLQLVRGVGDEVAAQHLEAVALGDVGHRDHDPAGQPAVGQREGPHGKGAGLGEDQGAAPRHRRPCGGRLLGQGGHLGHTEHPLGREPRPESIRQPEPRPGGRVGHQQPARPVQQQHPVVERVQI